MDLLNVHYAQGKYLDELGECYCGVKRIDGEPDEFYRVRILQAIGRNCNPAGPGAEVVPHQATNRNARPTVIHGAVTWDKVVEIKCSPEPLVITFKEDTCECGSQSIGIKGSGPAHSTWCPCWRKHD